MGFWDQLNTFKISSNPGTQIQKQSDPIHLEEDNQDLLKSVKLVNDATMRDGRPIPATGEITEIVVPDSDSGVKTVLVSCNPGEVKEINLIGGIRSGGSSAVIYQFYLREINTGKDDLAFYYLSSSDSGVLFNADSNYPTYPIILDEKISLVVEATGSDYTAVLFQAHTYRVR